LAEYAILLQNGAAHGHHLVVSGMQAAVEGIPLLAALAAWFYQTMASVCSSALKLIRIGQEGTQRALRAACLEAPAAVQASLLVPRSQAGSFGPLLEIASMRHLRAEERLFIS
jgi:urease accessory protein